MSIIHTGKIAFALTLGVSRAILRLARLEERVVALGAEVDAHCGSRAGVSFSEQLAKLDSELDDLLVLAGELEAAAERIQLRDRSMRGVWRARKRNEKRNVSRETGDEDEAPDTERG